jgi:2'-5' RNA ligase
MSKVYISAVVIIPPEEKWPTIQEIREKYDRQLSRWMPHITLLYPFKPENEYNILEKEFSDKCNHIKPFEIHLKQFKFFNHGKQQSKFLEIVPDCNDVNKYKDGFIPHLSLGQIKGKSNLDYVINKLQKKWKHISFLLDKIYFISREQHKKAKFEVIKSIYLQN